MLIDNVIKLRELYKVNNKILEIIVALCLWDYLIFETVKFDINKTYEELNYL